MATDVWNFYIDYTAKSVTMAWTGDRELLGPFPASISEQIVAWRDGRDSWSLNRMTGQLLWIQRHASGDEHETHFSCSASASPKPKF